VLANHECALARSIANALEGKFWQVTLGDWWVVVEGQSIQKLVVWTNDPFEISFSPQDTPLDLARVKWQVLQYLHQAAIISEDGAWSPYATPELQHVTPAAP